MRNYIFDIWIIALIVWQYYKREKSHKATIENLKNGIIPEPSNNRKDLLGIILIFIIAIIFFGFLIFLTFYFPIRIYPLLLMLPYGIGITIILLWRRDFLLYRKQRRPTNMETV